MKKYSALLIAFIMVFSFAACGGGTAAPAPAPEPEDTAIHVNTAIDLLNAIAPGAEIEIEPGTYNLTEAMRDAPDYISEYVYSTFNDGFQADIMDVNGLVIRGSKEGKVELVAEPRYCDVLCFKNCSDITLENITLGHTIEPGHCEGSVIELDDCQNITLNDLDLYGCGTYGVAANVVSVLDLNNCTIHDCTYGIIDLIECSDVAMKDCTLRDNRGYDMLSMNNAFITCEGCTFTGNTGDTFLPSYYSQNNVGGRFYACTFGPWESERVSVESKALENFVLGNDCKLDLSNIEDDQDTSFEYVPIDTSKMKIASFDKQVLMSEEYYILYQMSEKKTGKVEYETSDDVRFMSFFNEEQGNFWIDTEKGRPFTYTLDSQYSGQITFEDGEKASFGLYVDLGGALPRISEEGHIWLALYLGDLTYWFY